jgi:hypothetical protein
MAKKSRSKKAIKTPRAGATPQALIDEVKDTLKRDSPFDVSEITDCLDLRLDLGFTDDLKDALSSPFQRIARQYKPKAAISDADCDELTIVEDAVALVAERAGFAFAKGCA